MRVPRDIVLTSFLTTLWWNTFFVVILISSNSFLFKNAILINILTTSRILEVVPVILKHDYGHYDVYPESNYASKFMT